MMLERGDDGFRFGIVNGVFLAKQLDCPVVARSESGCDVTDAFACHELDGSRQPSYAEAAQARGKEIIGTCIDESRPYDKVGSVLNGIDESRYVAYVMLAVAVELDVDIVAVLARVHMPAFLRFKMKRRNTW